MKTSTQFLVFLLFIASPNHFFSQQIVPTQLLSTPAEAGSNPIKSDTALPQKQAGIYGVAESCKLIMPQNVSLDETGKQVTKNYPENLMVCTNWTVTPSSQSVPGSGGNYSASVSANGSCSYNVTPNQSWLHWVSYPGNGVFNYLVDNNSGAARTGSISINDAGNGINSVAILS